MPDPSLLLSVLYAAMERLVSAEMTAQLPAHRLSPTQYRALRYLRHYGGSELVGLSLAMEISAPAATKLADRLEKGGWVIRRSDQTDKRRTTLSLTAQAEDSLALLDKRIGLALSQVYEQLSISEQQQLIAGGEAFLLRSLHHFSAEKICQFCAQLHDESCPLSSTNIKRPSDDCQTVEE